MKYVDLYDLELYNPQVGGCNWSRIEMPLVYADAGTQIALFKLCDRGPSVLHHFGDPQLHPPPHPELESQNFEW